MTSNLIVMYGADWCGDCHRSRKFFERHQISFHWIDIDSDPQAQKIVRKINQGSIIIPTIFFKDGTYLVEPSDAEIAQKLGIPWQEDN